MNRTMKYEILRVVTPASRISCTRQPSARSVRVAALINEVQFVDSCELLEHHKTIFLEDAGRDSDWQHGVLYCHCHAMGVDETGDILEVLSGDDSAPTGGSKAKP